MSHEDRTDLRLCTGNTFIQAVRDALGIKALGQRVIIDAQAMGPVKVYLQLVGDRRLMQLDLETLLLGAELDVPGDAPDPDDIPF